MQQQDFLSDASAMLIALTMLYEDNPEWKDLMIIFATNVESFKEGDRWIEARASDFKQYILLHSTIQYLQVSVWQKWDSHGLPY